jgi:hypothetical protein
MFSYLSRFSLWVSSFLPPTGSPLVLFDGKILIDNIGTPWRRKTTKYIHTKAWMVIHPHIDMWHFGIGFDTHWHLAPEINFRFLFLNLHIIIRSQYWKLTKGERL